MGKAEEARATEPQITQPLAIADLVAVEDMGFTGGRRGLRAFCAQAFREGAPRFLRTRAHEVVLFRHADLRGFGVLPEVGSMAPAVLFPGLLDMGKGDAPQDASPPLGAAIAEVISNQVFTANPPIHGPLRRLLQGQLGPKQAAAMEEVAGALLRDILCTLPDGSEIDFVTDVAEQLTARFWGARIGMTDAEVQEAAHAARGMTALFYLDPDAETIAHADAAMARYRRVVSAAARRSLAQGGHSFVTELAEGLARIDLPDDPGEAGIVPKDVGALLAGNLVDGFHTAALACVNTLYALLHHPDAYAQVRETPALIPAAVMEALRCEPPVILLKRQALRDVVHDGVRIPAGTAVVMMWGAGNHDPSVYPDPLAFRLDRAHSGVTTFGTGVHICPGRNMAAMLARVLLRTLEEEGIGFAPCDPGEGAWIEGHMMNQLRTLPVRVVRRA